MKKWIIICGLVVVVVLGWVFGKQVLSSNGSEEAAGSQSGDGQYSVEFKPANGKAEIGTISIWHALVMDKDGKPVENAEITVSGGMPGHGHGLSTVPRVTGMVEPGVYAVDGMKFTMSGLWHFIVTVKTDDSDQIEEFNIELE